MAWGDLIGETDKGGQIQYGRGAAKGQMYEQVGSNFAGAINASSAYRMKNAQTKEQQDYEAGQAQQERDWRSGEAQKAWDRPAQRDAANASALEATLNALRGPTSDAAGAGAADLQQATGESVPLKSAPSSGQPGPSSPGIPKMSGFTDVAAAEAAWHMVRDDEARRRQWGQQDSDLGAAARSIDGVNGATDPRNPTRDVSGMDMAMSARGGYADDVARSAAALRQSDYVDPEAEKETDRTRGFQDVMRPLQLGQEKAHTAEEMARAIAALRGPQAKPPKQLTGSEVNQLLATSTGRQHEELRALSRRLEEAKKTLLNPYGVDPGTKQAAQNEVDQIQSRMNEIKAEIDGINEQWMGTLGQSYPGVNIPRVGAGPAMFDTSAIDQELARRGAAAPAPAGK